MKTAWEELKVINDARGDDRLEQIERIQREAFIRGAMTARGSHVDMTTMAGAIRAADDAIAGMDAVLGRKP
jgi:hypothetical protein